MFYNWVGPDRAVIWSNITKEEAESQMSKNGGHVEKMTKEEILKEFAEVMSMDESDEIQHNIQMTDDKHYRDWYNKKQKQEEIDQYGINED